MTELQVVWQLASLDPVLPWQVLLAVAAGLGLGCWYAGRDVLRLALVVTVLVAALRPGFGEAQGQGQLTDLEVLVVLDRTVSMSAQDYAGGRSRLDGVRADLTALAGGLPGSRFAVITFGRYARTEMPFTADVGAFDSAVATVRREGAFDGTGSVVSRPWREMRRTLARADREHPERRRIVVFLSDGENTARQPQRSFAPLRRYVDGGYVLGYGTRAGGRMPVDDPHGRSPGAPTSWVYDSARGADARSRLDAANLRRVAAQLGLRYVHRTSPGGIRQLAEDLDARPLTTGGATPVRFEATWLLALFAALLALTDLRRTIPWLLLARREARR